jgi:hypothetical protein
VTYIVIGAMYGAVIGLLFVIRYEFRLIRRQLIRRHRQAKP